MGTPANVNQEKSGRIYERALALGVAGGLAFWATNFATTLIPVAAEYRAELSISYTLMVLVESLLGGLIIGCCVAYALLRFHDRIPARNRVLKSVILSLIALVIIQGFASLLDLGYPAFYILLGWGLNVPRFLALGLVIGVLYDRLSVRVPGESNVLSRPSGL
jgi:hypothetical protein